MKHKDNKYLQAGSLHVVLLVGLIVIIIGALGLICWKQLTRLNTQAVVSMTSTAPALEATPHVLTIKEENIKITLPANAPIIKYAITNSSGNQDIQIYAASAISSTYKCQDKTSGYFMSLIKDSKERLQALGDDPYKNSTVIGDTVWSAGLIGVCDDATTNNLIREVIAGISAS